VQAIIILDFGSFIERLIIMECACSQESFSMKYRNILKPTFTCENARFNVPESFSVLEGFWHSNVPENFWHSNVLEVKEHFLIHVPSPGTHSKSAGTVPDICAR
jgi:hypothetical protein